jgi:NAD(P)-dependent dehydrogenase (short-subunit alcohol dehydrogenase family)
MDLGLRDACVVVAGASRGIGRGIAKRFAEEGARLALIARNEKGLEKTAAQCQELGCREVIIAPADMSDSQAVEVAFARIRAAWSSVNVLINNAANSVGTHGTFEALSSEAPYLETYNRVTLGYVRTTRAALPLLKAAEWSRIVNLGTSGSGTGSPNLHVYLMAKNAVISMSRSQAREFAPFGISVNVLSPGGIMVEGGNWGAVMNGYFAQHDLDPSNPYHAVELSSRQFGGPKPWMDRYGLIDEYAHVAAFLGSRVNSYMTGQNVVVQGGAND